MDDYRDDVKALMDEMLLRIPGVSGGKAFGYPAYKVGGKVFLFVGGAGIAVKLPVERVGALIAANDAMYLFEPVEGRVWKSWVSIDHANVDDYAQHEALLEEAIAFVRGA